MPPFYAETRVPRCDRTELVGELNNAIIRTPNTPWANATVSVRKRVYAVRVPNRTQVAIVTIAGTKISGNRKWTATTAFNLAVGNRVARNTRMKGKFRAPAGPPAAPDPELAARWAANREALRARRVAQMAEINRRNAERRAERAAAAVRYGLEPRDMEHVPPPAADESWMNAVRRYVFEGLEAVVPLPRPAPQPPPPVRQPGQVHPRPPHRPGSPVRQALPALPATEPCAVAEATPDCSICFGGKASMVFVPCGHRCACLSCAKSIAASANKGCPLCRASGGFLFIRD